MRKSRLYKRPKPENTLKQFRANSQILAPKLVVIDENGTTLGVMTRQQALDLTAERELDLIEVSPVAQPPVARIMDFGKFQYQQEKLERKQRASQKKIEIKGIRVSLRIGEHDLNIRKKQALEFLQDSQKVRIEMILKGRERQYLQNARSIMEDFVRACGELAKVEMPFTNQGGRLSILMAPKNQ